MTIQKRKEENMRDVDRIDILCENLCKLWHHFPDQRLGQLISNFIITDPDIFFQEDDVSIEKIMKLLEKIEK